MKETPLAEEILSARAGRRVRPGDVVVCEPDLVLGTDGSVPMALDYFEAMGGEEVARPERVLFARDHYAPATTDSTRGFHDRMQTFADRHGVEILEVGEGISFLHALEHGRAGPGDLVVGGDSHTVTCGVAGAFAVGIGSSDLAGALLTSRVWLRVPNTRRIELTGSLPTGVVGKDVALELARRAGGNAGPFVCLEWMGDGVATLPEEEKTVVANMAAEMGAMAGIFRDEAERSQAPPDDTLDLSGLEPLVALPPRPDHAVPVGEALGRPVDWVFLGTCAGGRASDFREAARVLAAGGGLADGVTLVVTPPTAGIRRMLEDDGTLAALEQMGAAISETGCGPCCGTSGPLPPPHARVMSTANRNFSARMGDATVEIMLASSATCAAAATRGRVVDPREVA